MIITLSPMRSDGALDIARHGDVLTINGMTLDLSVIPEGATLPPGAVDSPWIVGPISRTAGVLRLTILLPHGASAGPDVRYPAPLTITSDGPVALPDTHPEEVPQ